MGLPCDHIAAGAFESALNLLSKQIGAVNFPPLEPRFMEIYAASRSYLPANPGLPPLKNFLRRTTTETDTRKLLPLIPRDVESVLAKEVGRQERNESQQARR